MCIRDRGTAGEHQHQSDPDATDQVARAPWVVHVIDRPLPDTIAGAISTTWTRVAQHAIESRGSNSGELASLGHSGQSSATSRSIVRSARRWHAEGHRLAEDRPGRGDEGQLIE